jgi:hypothetical protein
LISTPQQREPPVEAIDELTPDCEVLVGLGQSRLRPFRERLD